MSHHLKGCVSNACVCVCPGVYCSSSIPVPFLCRNDRNRIVMANGVDNGLGRNSEQASVNKMAIYLRRINRGVTILACVERIMAPV